MDFPDVAPELLATLPPVLRAIVRALGFARAQEWLHTFGGLVIHLPKYKATALNLTADELNRLRETLAPHLDTDGRLSVPKPDKILNLHRNHAIIANAHKDSLAQQARQYNLTTRHIQNIRRLADTGTQMDLFD